MNKNARKSHKLSLLQKVIFIICGIFFTLAIGEIGLRAGSFILSFLQEHHNLTSIRQKGTYVIMCLGESTTAGGADAYPAQVEKILNQNKIGIKFAVVNKGVPTINTQYILQHLEENLNRYHPDMVITMMGINDKNIKYYEGMRDANTMVFNRFKTYRFIRLLWKSILDRLRSASIYKKEGSVAPGEEAIVSAPPVGEEPKSHMASSKGEQIEYLVKEKAAEGSAELISSPDAYMNSGKLYREEANYLQAEEAFKKAIDLNPKSVEAYNELGWLYMQQEKFSSAEEIFNKAVELNSRIYMTYFGLGLLHKVKQDYPQAEEAFKKAMEMDPTIDTAYVELGSLYIYNGDYAKAEEIFKRAIEFCPGSEKMYRALIELYRQTGNNRAFTEYRYRLKNKFGLKDDSVTDLTYRNYRKLKKILDQRKIQLVCVQYPVRSIKPLKRIFEGEDNIIFIDNEKLFKDAVSKGGYKEYFVDIFGGDFGHCSTKGHRLLAENIAGIILKEVFHQ